MTVSFVHMAASAHCVIVSVVVCSAPITDTVRHKD